MSVLVVQGLSKSFGGVQAVTWTDVKQMVVIVGALVAVVIVLLVRLPVSPDDALRIAGARGNNLKDVTADDVELAVVRPPAKKGMKAKELPAERVALDRLGPAIVQVEWSPAQQAGDADAAAGEDTAEHTEA